MNCVVGRNGSGKSNLFDAVQFVLGCPKFWSLRTVRRPQLFNFLINLEGGGLHVSRGGVCGVGWEGGRRSGPPISCASLFLANHKYHQGGGEGVQYR